MNREAYLLRFTSDAFLWNGKNYQKTYKKSTSLFDANAKL